MRAPVAGDVDRVRAILSATDPWAIVLAVAVALLVSIFAARGELNPLFAIAGAAAVLVVHRLAEVANSVGVGRQPGLLTRREIEIVCHIGEGSTNLEIAGALAVNEDTVEDHVRNVRRKLRLRDRSAIKRWYNRNRRMLEQKRAQPIKPVR